MPCPILTTGVTQSFTSAITTSFIIRPCQKNDDDDEYTLACKLKGKYVSPSGQKVAQLK